MVRVPVKVAIQIDMHHHGEDVRARDVVVIGDVAK
jgi:hypothetical protein